MIPVRFTEHDRYDINRDCDTTVFTATTPRGSYWTEITKEGAMKYREQRDRFKSFVTECIQNDIDPGEIELNE